MTDKAVRRRVRFIGSGRDGGVMSRPNPILVITRLSSGLAFGQALANRRLPLALALLNLGRGKSGHGQRLTLSSLPS